MQSLLKKICTGIVWPILQPLSELVGSKAVTIAQVVSRRLPTAASRVRAQVRSCGICVGQSGIDAGFLRVLRFPLPILIPPTAPHPSSFIIRGWYSKTNNGRDVPSGLSLTPWVKTSWLKWWSFWLASTVVEAQLGHRLFWPTFLFVLLSPFGQMAG
jgi:hypothetical protein